MATLVLSAAGSAAGMSLGGGLMGMGSAVIGRALGATLGRVVDQSILGGGSDVVETARVDRFRLTSAGEGTPIPRLFGRLRVGGQVIWASRFREDVETTGGGKGAPARPEVREYSYSVSLAVGLCEGVVSHIGRVWADGQEISRDDMTLRLYPGDEEQLPDPTMTAIEGPGNVPAYRGLAYVLIEDLDLGRFGNRVPQFTFEVMRPEPDGIDAVAGLARSIRGVAMMPGTGEYSLATTPVYARDGSGLERPLNVNTPLGRTDFTASVEALTGELPRCGSTSLIVSWFGDDLRCGACTIAPKVELKDLDGASMDWNVSGIGRAQAGSVPMRDGKVVYGGTPTDKSVIEAVRALRDAGQDVMFYPFLLMEQLERNARPDPYTGDPDQPVLPWRGRITLSVAPGRPGSPDRLADADMEVASFFGKAGRDDFKRTGDGVAYVGPPENSYRRFILHYAHLCAAAGGVHSFCIGSEMRGLTWIRGAAGFPAVGALRDLARDVRTILGPGTKIGYAADWSEYFGYRPDDGSGDVYFHLDPLWADRDIDFIGIDNYMPLSDWRDGEDHADAAWETIYSLDYLKANIAGGEGFDWYYADDTASRAQRRTPIRDGAHGEDWIYRYKDIRAWWSRPHHERKAGVRAANPTAWVPESKPIWFTEIGCAAIDKGANQPNKFLDPKSSESSLPYYSNGSRDDLMQMQYLRAIFDYWGDPENNPTSRRYDGAMVDMARAHVWAWDARPYPFFPGRPDLWSDAENYMRGHWITGRVTSRSLSSVVTEICMQAGVSDPDVSRLHGLVRGYQLPDTMSARAALQPLMLAFGFDALERDGRLVFRSRTFGNSVPVNRQEVAVSPDLDGDVEFSRAADAERTGRLRLSFIEADQDYDAATAEAVFPGGASSFVSQTDYPLVLTRGEARAITERWLAESRIARDRIRFSLPPSRSDIGVGDMIEMEGGVYRIDHAEIGPQQMLEGQRIEREVYHPADRGDDVPRLPSYAAPAPVFPVFLDLPALDAGEATLAPHVAVSAQPWPGAVALYSSPGEDGFTLDTVLARRSIIGTTQSELPAAQSGIYDNGPALRVRLFHGALASVSQTQLLAGENAMAIGTGQDQEWEVLQFRDAELVGPNTYDLRARLRGQLGTDALMPSRWPVGSRVVLLRSSLERLPLKPSMRGVERVYRVGPAGRPVTDRLYVQRRLAFEGMGLRPYSPVHLKALRRDDGSLHVEWIRRTRIEGDLWGGLDVPLGEEAELYVVTVTSRGEIVREEYSQSTRWIYAPEQQQQDRVGSPFTVDVAQVSSRFGPGPAASIRVSA